MKRIALLGEFSNIRTAHCHERGDRTLRRSTWSFSDGGMDFNVDAGMFERCVAIWVAPGSPYKRSRSDPVGHPVRARAQDPVLRNVWGLSAHRARVRSQ